MLDNCEGIIRGFGQKKTIKIAKVSTIRHMRIYERHMHG
jgi:hypothetical protein